MGVYSAREHFVEDSPRIRVREEGHFRRIFDWKCKNPTRYNSKKVL